MAELEKKREIFSDDPEIDEFCNDLLTGVREMKAGIAARCTRVAVPSVDGTGIRSKVGLTKKPFVESWTAFRKERCAYVDKTELIYQLAKDSGKFLLARPGCFGKTLLVSALEFLFQHGVRDFAGLAIEKVWADKTYNVVRLDFSCIAVFSDLADFERKHENLLIRSFGKIGFQGKSGTSVTQQLAGWLEDLPTRSLVILIDNFDSPLTACLNDETLFKRIRAELNAFYAVLKSCDNCLRFLLLTGAMKVGGSGLFSGLNNLTDLTLNPRFGALLGFTSEEMTGTFSGYLGRARRKLNMPLDELMLELERRYGGYCFEGGGRVRVFSPESVLSFLSNPDLGFRNFRTMNADFSAVLKKYLPDEELLRSIVDNEPQEVRLSALEDVMDVEDIDALVLLNQAGCLTIKSVASDGWAELGCPNREMLDLMAEALGDS